jgi:small subunit ribosomal protein S8
MTDPISDFLTRLRNALKAKHRIVAIPASSFKKEIARILYEKGYIAGYRFEDTADRQGVIKVALKYHPVTKAPAIRHLRRVSRPGLRQYRGHENLPRVLNGLGIAILSTSRGVMTNKEAFKEGIGGEVVCYVY